MEWMGLGKGVAGVGGAGGFREGNTWLAAWLVGLGRGIGNWDFKTIPFCILHTVHAAFFGLGHTIQGSFVLLNWRDAQA